MNNFEINLLIAFSICLVSWLLFLKLTKGVVTINGPDGADNLAGGDNGNLLRATAKSSEWRWPSDMHTKTYTGTSTTQRDITVLLLILFQKLVRDRKTEYSLTSLWSFTHLLSGLLIYLIGANYWNPAVALFISLLYLSTFWMWQMSLWVGHLNVGTMFFLLGVYFSTLSIGAIGLPLYTWLVVSGICFGCMLFSSSSAPRYILAFFAAIFWARHSNLISDLSLAGLYNTILTNNAFWPSLVITLLVIIFSFLVSIFHKQLITAIFNRKAGPLNGIIKAKKYPLEHYLKTGKEKLSAGIKIIIKPYIFLFILANLLGLKYFLSIFGGYLLVFLILMLPDVKRNFTLYFNYLYISYIKPGVNSGLVRYVRLGYFAKNNIEVPNNLRGGGFGWVPKIYFFMAPFHTVLYLAAVAAILIYKPIEAGAAALLILVSLSPIIWAEMTKAYQVSRSYSSGVLGFILLFGFTAYSFQGWGNFWNLAITLLIITTSWNAWKFFYEIYPARMSFNKTVRALAKFNVKEINTYKTFYNDTFLYNLSLTPETKNIKVNFINSLDEVKNGWIYIPPTTHKVGFIRQEDSILAGDFDQDPHLNELLKTRKIEELAAAKFKTISGPGRVWLQEPDIITYLDLMADNITRDDHFRGYAWLVHSSRLSMDNSQF